MLAAEVSGHIATRALHGARDPGRPGRLRGVLPAGLVPPRSTAHRPRPGLPRQQRATLRPRYGIVAVRRNSGWSFMKATRSASWHAMQAARASPKAVRARAASRERKAASTGS